MHNDDEEDEEDEDKEEEVENMNEVNDDTDGRTESEIEAWRACRVGGKAYNIVHYIRKTPQHRSAFLNQQLEVMRGEPAVILCAQKNTRWNIIEAMIKTLLKERERIDSLIHKTPELKDDRLMFQDWKDLEEMLELLIPFKLITIQGQKKGMRNGSIVTALPVFDMLLNYLEQVKKKT